ncbi:MAG: flagellar FlbD family protein [Defluviitaleaceae bacterium]|nr:flagellar FlbD family protein [Defluviitaleaceae bacterium]
MIKLTKLSGVEFVVNSDLIEFIEVLPDTTISMTTGKKIIVKEDIEDVVNKIMEFKSDVYTKIK